MNTLKTLQRLAKQGEKEPKLDPMLEQILSRFPAGIFAEQTKKDPEYQQICLWEHGLNTKKPPRGKDPEYQQILRDWIYLMTNEDTKPRFQRLIKLAMESDQ